MIYSLVIAIAQISLFYAATLPLWPQPVSVTVGTSTIAFSSDFHFYQNNPSHRVSGRLAKAIHRYEKRIEAYYESHKSAEADKRLSSLDKCEVSVKNIITDDVEEANTLDLNVDETYSIKLSDDSCAMTSETIWGSFRALETFIQLLEYDATSSSVICQYSPVSISDYPRFSHRGLLIDTSRHYLPVETIYALIESLPISKLNTLHWHMVDAEAFPFKSVSEPLMVQGAYTEASIYTVDQLSALTAFALDRGVRIIFEIDVPGHTASWADGKPEIVADCTAKYSNVENYALNPGVDDAYVTIQGVVQDLINAQASSYNTKYIHLGGDETVYSCWANDSSVVAFMNEEGFKSYGDLFNYFINRTDSMVSDAFAVSIIHWEEVYFAGARVPDNTVFQVWTDASKMAAVADAGHPIIASPSDYWYLNYVSIDWKTMYSYDPATNLTSTQASYLIGGEACVWGELVDQSNLQATIYPRLSAVAERLWSPSTVNNVDDAKARLTILRCRLVEAGFHSAAIQPDHCYVQYI
jgi:hexosaminidase